jgi:hypothetical protein
MELYNAPAIIDAVGNTSIGHQSLQFCYSGDYNVSIGYDCGLSIQTGNSNIFIGNTANGANATDNQIAIGNMALTASSGAICVGNTSTASGVGDVVIGQNADSGTGGNSVVIGNSSGNSLALSDSNTLIGSNVCTKIVRSVKNTCIGAYAGGNLVGDPALLTYGYNICIGYESMYRSDVSVNATIADQNVAIGYRTLWNTTTGSRNICIGYRAGDTITTANGCICIGSDSDVATGIIDQIAFGGSSTCSAQGSISFGTFTGASGIGSVAIGSAGNGVFGSGANAGGNYSVAIGGGDILNTGARSTANYGIAIGYNTFCNSAGGLCIGKTLSTGIGASNIIIGNTIGQTLTSGAYNIIMGSTCAGMLSTGEYNVIIGYNCAPVLTNNNNIIIGKQAGGGISSSFSSIIIGTNAGSSITTGEYNICIGQGSDANSISTRQIAIGAFASTSANNTIAIGNTTTAVGANSVAIGSNVTAPENCIGLGNLSNYVSIGGYNGILTSSTKLQISGSANYVNSIISAFSINLSHYPISYFLKSHNDTLGSLTATLNGEILGGLAFYGINSSNTAHAKGALITCIQNGAAGINYTPSDLVFYTSPNGTTDAVERAKITSNGAIDIASGGIINFTSEEANRKIVLWGKELPNYYGFGINTNILRYNTPLAGNHNFYVNNTLIFSVNGTGIWKSAGSFKIPHPDPIKTSKKHLVHCFVESPTRGDNLYRFKTHVEGGKGEVILPDYWKHLNENPQVWVNPIECFARCYGEVDATMSKINIYADSDGYFNVLLIGTRKDSYAYKHFDENGGVEPDIQ